MKKTFIDYSLPEFWISFAKEYLVILAIALPRKSMKVIIPFDTIYLSETGFSVTP